MQEEPSCVKEHLGDPETEEALCGQAGDWSIWTEPLAHFDFANWQGCPACRAVFLSWL